MQENVYQKGGKYSPKGTHNSSCNITCPSAQQFGQTKIRYLSIEVIINQYIA